jgi:hypothetical protein
MDWRPLFEPPDYAWITPKLRAERQRIVKQISQVMEMRAKCEALESEVRKSWAVDPAVTDRRRFFESAIAALEKEVATRESLMVFELAVNTLMAEMRQRAADELHAIEAETRQSLEVADDTPLNHILSALQCQPRWHVARRKYHAMPDPWSNSLEMESFQTQAAGEIKKFGNVLSLETKRLEDAARGRQRDAEFAAKMQRAQDKKTEPQRELEMRAAELLK